MPTVRTVIFMRHGDTGRIDPQMFFGRTDVALSEAGRNMAAGAATRLSRMRIDSIYTGPLVRCVQTARLLKLAPEIKIEQGLNEISFGDWEGKTHAQCQMDEEAWAAYTANLDGAPPQGESLYAFNLRVMEAYQGVLDQTKDAKVLLIITHHSVIRAIIANELGMGAEGAFHFRCAPGSLSSIDYIDGFATLSRWNA